MKSPLLLHIPHASAHIPAAYRNSFQGDIARELLLMTDRYTDELFDYPAARLVFPISRLVCDVERFRDDAMEPMSRRGMGACYTHGHDGNRIRFLTAEQKESLLVRWYDPHHAALAEMTEKQLKEHGRCLIVDCHSFHPTPLPYEPDQREQRPDICLGTDPFHTKKETAAALLKAFAERGYSVSFNTPYAGAIVPLPCCRVDPRVQSVMIEVNRRLYLKPDFQKSPAFSRVREDIAAALDQL